MTNFARARPAAKTDVDINQIVHTALRLASFDEAFQNIEISSDLAEDLAPVHADEDQLQQVFLNLFLNARDAMADGGTLSIKTLEQDEKIVIEVGDSGTGIAETDRKLIFDPFFTTKSAGKGTGLGLAVCYGIISAHGGEISALPNAEKGTSFIVSLPIYNRSESQ